MSLAKTILVVDDEIAVAESHALILNDLGYTTITEIDPRKVETVLAQRTDIDLILLDIQMPHIRGIDLMKIINAQHPHIGIIFITVEHDIEQAVKAIKTGAYNYLLKPIQKDRLQVILESYFRNKVEPLLQDTRFNSFITQDLAFKDVFICIQQFAETDFDIFLQGEPGTGKSMLATILHSCSQVASAPFLTVNLAGLSVAAFDAELFGHCQGACPEANHHKTGYLQLVESGTLYLHGIGEISIEQQNKLLQVLQTKRYRKAGETNDRVLNARIIISSNLDLQQEMKAKRFSKKLYYYLSKHSLLIPPLRDRAQDIKLLANYFLDKYCTQFDRQLNGYSEAALKLLHHYSFPGNITELDGIVSTAVLIESGTQIEANTLPEHLQPTQTDGDIAQSRFQTVMKALAKNNGNQTKAAKQLGIARQTLHTWLKDYRAEK